MALSRRLGVIGILSMSWLVAVGCGSDDDKHANFTGDAGEAGENAGGTPASGGSSSNAGKGGTSSAGKGGTAGTAGKGGSGGASAGTGGTSIVGEAGQGGDATSLAGAGGAPETPVGGAGAGGEGGTPAVETKLCAYECEMDDDCAIEGAAVQNICDPNRKRCVDPTVTACQTVDDCAPSASLWFTTCQATTDCDEGYACIDWHGTGYCAYTPDCFPGDVQITLGEFGKPDSPIDVCYTPGACVAGACQFGCEFLGCEAGDGATCSPTTHECECTTGGDECVVTGVCGADHHCVECAVDDDCAGAGTGLDHCVNGKCGCSGTAACPDLTANATPVCE